MIHRIIVKETRHEILAESQGTRRSSGTRPPGSHDTCILPPLLNATWFDFPKSWKKKIPLHCQRTKIPMTHQQSRIGTRYTRRHVMTCLETHHNFFFFFLRGTQYPHSLLRGRITNLKIYVTRVHQPNLSHPRISLKNPSHWSIKRFQSPSVSNPTGLWVKIQRLRFHAFLYI